MALKDDLRKWVIQAIDANGGRAGLIEVARHIWENHETELKAHGDGFYTWQYDMRWAAQDLRNKGVLANAKATKRGIWERKIITT